MKVAVIGAGPAGLTAGLKLAEAGKAVAVFEASAVPGGMARSFELWGRIVDVGPHRFFSKDPRVNSFWLEQVQGEYHMVSRTTRILYRGRLFAYPLKAWNALRNLGLVESIRAIASYFRYRARPLKDESSFENWVVNRFGRHLFNVFFRSYTEKLWGVDCRYLDADFAAQRIKRFSLGEAVKSALSPKRSSKHRTLVDVFAYPDKGAGYPYEVMARKIQSNGGNVNYNAALIGIEPAESSWKLSTSDGKAYIADIVVSTMPITSLVRLLDAPIEVKEAASKLRFRNTILVYLHIDGKLPLPDQWLYVQSEELKTGRITNFDSWSVAGSESSQSIIALEYWCFDGDEVWTKDDSELIEMAKYDFLISGISFNLGVQEGFVVRVPKCYPVYDSGYQRQLKIVQDYFDGCVGVLPIGRYGSFKYNNQDHSILMGILASENILTNADHNLWGINADDEYQESSVIDETGLVIDKPV